jgi:hypothetical protein
MEVSFSAPTGGCLVREAELDDDTSLLPDPDWCKNYVIIVSADI